jgi:hypothetical protein
MAETSWISRRGKARVGLVVMRERALWRLVRPMSCPLGFGSVVLVAELLVVCPLRQVPPAIWLGVACPVVATVGGWR